MKIPGKEIMLGGQPRVIAPLNAATLKVHGDKIKTIFVGQVPDLVFVSQLAYESLKRNYADITPEEVDEFIDFGNLFDVWEAILNASGLAVAAGKMVRRVQEEVEAGLTKQ